MAGGVASACSCKDNAHLLQVCNDFLYAGDHGPGPARVPPHVHRGYEAAQKALAAREPLEASVAAGLPPDETLLTNFIGYISFEKARLCG